jgi:hypothetical protein
VAVASARSLPPYSQFVFARARRNPQFSPPNVLPFSGGRERERSDRRARPTATAGWTALPGDQFLRARTIRVTPPS